MTEDEEQTINQLSSYLANTQAFMDVMKSQIASLQRQNDVLRAENEDLKSRLKFHRVSGIEIKEEPERPDFMGENC